MALRILVVDDQPEIGAAIKAIAESLGHQVTAITESEAFKSAYLKSSPDLVMMDMAIPDCDGLELMEFLAATGCTTSIAIMSGGGDYFLSIAQTFAKLHKLNIVAVLEKPFKRGALTGLLDSVGNSSSALQAS